MLEVLYSTGIRRSELARLRKLCDIEAERGTLTVRQGKGKKDRVVPIGERAIAWVEKYAHGGEAGAVGAAGRGAAVPDEPRGAAVAWTR